MDWGVTAMDSRIALAKILFVRKPEVMTQSRGSMSVNAFHEKASRSQVDLFGSLLERFFSTRVITLSPSFHPQFPESHMT